MLDTLHFLGHHDHNLIFRRLAMNEERINVAGAKKHFSEILGKVAYGKKHIIITKRGKPMARLIPAEETHVHLSHAHGWLEEDDPFFATIEHIIRERSKHASRIIREAS
jgi:prevent-host-death family protein